MIPLDHITAWRERAPWASDAHVEQDLVLSRVIIELFSDPELAKTLAFRGGTAMYKLHIQPAARYSEDIDLVQIRSGAIGETLDRIRERLDPWLGEPRRQAGEGRVSLAYRFDSEAPPSIRMRVKVEINSREHFSHLGHIQLPLRVENPWFNGEVGVTTYALDELAGTKLRALYQRKKGRDLFDLWLGLNRGLLNPAMVVGCFQKYMEHGGARVTRAQFEANLSGKADDPRFRDDVPPLLAAAIEYDHHKALQKVRQELVTLLPGAAWAGKD